MAEVSGRVVSAGGAGVVVAGVVGDGGDVGDRPGLAGQHGVVAVPDGADFGGAVVVAEVGVLIGGDVAGAAAGAGGDGFEVAGEPAGWTAGSFPSWSGCPGRRCTS